MAGDDLVPGAETAGARAEDGRGATVWGIVNLGASAEVRGSGGLAAGAGLAGGERAAPVGGIFSVGFV